VSQFAVGDWVSWMTWIRSGWSRRVGTVLEVVPPGQRSKELSWDTQIRAVESCIVSSNGKRNGKRWWPEYVRPAKTGKVRYALGAARKPSQT